MSLLLVRHGETALNAARVLQHADTPLSERGLMQAEALAWRLAVMKIGAILSSDLPRALRTAEAIARVTGAPIETTPLLRERNFGELRGQPHDDLPVSPLHMIEAPPGGESAQAFAQRVSLAFGLTLQRCAALARPLVVVSHGLVIRQMLAVHVRLAPGTEQAPLGNTSVSIVAASPPHSVTLLNCTRHLGTPLKDGARALPGG